MATLRRKTNKQKRKEKEKKRKNNKSIKNGLALEMVKENVDIFLLMFKQMNERIGFDFILHLILIIEKFIELQLWYVVIDCLFV